MPAGVQATWEHRSPSPMCTYFVQERLPPQDTGTVICAKDGLGVFDFTKLNKMK